MSALFQGQTAANGIDVDKAIRDAQIVDAINRAMVKPGEPKASTQAILDTIERGKSGPGGHQWPPIIRMSEADGYFFKTYANYIVAFYTAGVLAAVAFIAILFAHRPEEKKTSVATTPVLPQPKGAHA